MMAAMNTLRTVLGCLRNPVDESYKRRVLGQICVLREYSEAND